MSLIARNINLKIGKKTLLQSVNLEVHPGEFLAILGPNGAGKSSFFKVLTREFAFFEGEVELNGKNYTDWKPGEIALQLGVLPQSSTLNFPFSAYEVVMLGRLPHSTGRTKNRQIIWEALQTVDASHLAESSYLSLSGGEKQRVQLARILAQIWEAPDAIYGDRFLLLDEPTSALDLSHQHLILKLAKELTHKSVGVVAILHDLNLASEYADRIMMLKEGQVHAEGNAVDVLTPDTIQQLLDIEVDVLENPKSQRPLVISSSQLSSTNI